MWVQNEEWADDNVFSSIKEEEYRFLSGQSFSECPTFKPTHQTCGHLEFAEDGDGDLDDVVDEDLRNDPISQVDLRVSCLMLPRTSIFD